VPNHQEPNIFFCCYRQIGVPGATCAGRYLYACFRCTTIASQFNLFRWRLIEDFNDWKQEKCLRDKGNLGTRLDESPTQHTGRKQDVSLQQYVFPCTIHISAATDAQQADPAGKKKSSSPIALANAVAALSKKPLSAAPLLVPHNTFKPLEFRRLLSVPRRHRQ
jgi:hypothetical protein